MSYRRNPDRLRSHVPPPDCTSLRNFVTEACLSSPRSRSSRATTAQIGRSVGRRRKRPPEKTYATFGPHDTCNLVTEGSRLNMIYPSDKLPIRLRAPSHPGNCARAADHCLCLRVRDLREGQREAGDGARLERSACGTRSFLPFRSPQTGYKNGFTKYSLCKPQKYKLTDTEE